MASDDVQTSDSTGKTDVTAAAMMRLADSIDGLAKAIVSTAEMTAVEIVPCDEGDCQEWEIRRGAGVTASGAGEPETEAEPKTELGTDPKPEPETAPEAKPDTETEAETPPAPEPEIEPETETKPKGEPESVARIPRFAEPTSLSVVPADDMCQPGQCCQDAASETGGRHRRPERATAL